MDTSHYRPVTLQDVASWHKYLPEATVGKCCLQGKKAAKRKEGKRYDSLISCFLCYLFGLITLEITKRTQVY